MSPVFGVRYGSGLIAPTRRRRRTAADTYPGSRRRPRGSSTTPPGARKSSEQGEMEFQATQGMGTNQAYDQGFGSKETGREGKASQQGVKQSGRCQ